MQSLYEQNGGTYTEINGYLIPNLTAPKMPAIGKYGRMRLQYLKTHRNGIYTGMLLTGKLNDHLIETDRSANQMMLTQMEQLAKTQGITEKLKATDQMLWVQRMNNIRNAAEEIVLEEIIYA